MAVKIPYEAREKALAALVEDKDWHKPDSGGVWRANYHRAVELVLEAAAPVFAAQPVEPVAPTVTPVDGWTFVGPAIGSYVAEPVPDRQPSDAAVEAGAEAYWDGERYADELNWSELSDQEPDDAENYRRLSRAVLEAAYRVDAPRPLLDRDAVRKLAQHHLPFTFAGSVTGAEIANAVMGLARPMPTREQIGDAVHDAVHRFGSEQCMLPRAGETSNCYQRTMRTADAVLALLNGAES